MYGGGRGPQKSRKAASNGAAAWTSGDREPGSFAWRMHLSRSWRNGLPKTHRRIRDFYDTYGFPLAKRIRSPYAADAVYFLMKPLEWIFLAVIYAVDVRPENRIAVQYLPERFSK